LKSDRTQEQYTVSDKSSKVLTFKPRRPAGARIVRYASEERLVARASGERRFFSGAPDGRFAQCACGRRERA
jgi:hypothetical protein